MKTKTQTKLKVKKSNKSKTAGKKKSYTVEVRCTNCHHPHYSMKVPYGTKADTEYLREQKCRDCGCTGQISRY